MPEYFLFPNISRVLKNSDDRDESKFESEQGDSPRSWAGSPASGEQRRTDSKGPHPERVVAAHRTLRRSLEPAGLASTAQAALEVPARSHNHGVSAFFSTLIGVQ